MYIIYILHMHTLACEYNGTPHINSNYYETLQFPFDLIHYSNINQFKLSINHKKCGSLMIA